MKLYNTKNEAGMKLVCDLNCGSPLKIYRIKYTKEWDGDDWHFHPHGYEYYFVLNGQITVQVEKEEVVVCEGEMLCVYPGETHRVLGGRADQDTIVFRQEFQKNDKVIVEEEQ